MYAQGTDHGCVRGIPYKFHHARYYSAIGNKNKHWKCGQVSGRALYLGTRYEVHNGDTIEMIPGSRDSEAGKRAHDPLGAAEAGPSISQIVAYNPPTTYT